MNSQNLRKELSIDNWDDVKRMFKTHGLVSGGLEYHGHEPKAPNSETTQFRALGEVDRMTLHSLVASGGKIVVIGGRMNPLWNRFADNPRVVFWTGDRQEIERHLGRGPTNMPSNTHGVILSRFISHTISTRIIEEARRRKIVIMGPKNDGEVTKLLENIFEESTAMPKTVAVELPKESPKEFRSVRHGEITEWVLKHDDPTKTIKEVSEILFNKMLAEGVQTTINSVAVGIGNVRRKAGVYANPVLSRTLAARNAARKAPKLEVLTKEQKPVVVKVKPHKQVKAVKKTMPTLAADSNTQTLLRMIDDLVAGISLLRDEVEKMQQQNDEYRKLEATLTQIGWKK